ncbi:MAG: hypothetical protein R3C68_05500 [Myxococcota bacterium]
METMMQTTPVTPAVKRLTEHHKPVAATALTATHPALKGAGTLPQPTLGKTFTAKFTVSGPKQAPMLTSALPAPQVRRVASKSYDKIRTAAVATLQRAIPHAPNAKMRQMLEHTLSKARTMRIKYSDDLHHCDTINWSYTDKRHPNTMFMCPKGDRGHTRGQVMMGVHEPAHLAGYREPDVQKIQAFAMRYYVAPQ